METEETETKYDVRIDVVQYQVRFVPQNHPKHAHINIWHKSPTSEPDARLYFSDEPYQPATKVGTVYKVFYSSDALSGVISMFNTLKGSCELWIESSTGDSLLQARG